MTDPPPNARDIGTRPDAIQAAIERLQIPAQVGDVDLGCPGCGYNLRGLLTAGRCPECAAPVWTAFVKRTLAFADPRWIAQLSSGQTWLKFSGLLLLVAGPAAWLTFVPPAATVAIQFSVTTLAMLGFAVAMWKLSAPNPADSAAGNATLLNPSSIARIALIVTLFGSIAAVALGIATGFGSTATVIALAASPVGLCGGVFFIALALAIERVATLAGDSFGADRTRSYRRGFSVCWPVFLVSWIFVGAVPFLGFPLLFSGFGLFGFGALIVLSPTYFAAHLRAAQELADLIRSNPDAILAEFATSTPGEAAST